MFRESLSWIAIAVCALAVSGCVKKTTSKDGASKNEASKTGASKTGASKDGASKTGDPMGKPAMGSSNAPARKRPQNPCQPSKVDRSSLHASVLFKTSILPPKTKRKELFDCAGRSVALYRYEYASPKKASEAAMYMGAQLWGSGGPSRRHADGVMVRGAEVVVLSPRPGSLGAHLAQQGYKAYRGQRRRPASSVGRTPAAPVGMMPELASLYRAARCHSAKSPFRPWCIVTNGWKRGQASPLLPKGKQKVFVGFAVPIKTGAAVNFNRLKLAALVVRKDGSKYFATIITVTPDNDKERKVMAQAVFDLALVFKGRSKAAKIDSKLLGFLRGRASKASYVLTKTAKSWSLAGKINAQIRKVGPYWVALERAPKGVFVNLFTDRFVASSSGK